MTEEQNKNWAISVAACEEALAQGIDDESERYAAEITLTVNAELARLTAHVAELEGKLRWRKYPEERPEEIDTVVLVRDGMTGRLLITNGVVPGDLWFPLPEHAQEPTTHYCDCGSGEILEPPRVYCTKCAPNCNPPIPLPTRGTQA